MTTTPLILDLGCGTAKTKGAIGVDVVPLAGVDLVGNLSERPYPFAESSFDAIVLNDVIEHIPNTIRTMEEIYRLLKPDGRAFIRVVNWNSIYTAMDPTHLSAYTENTFDFFGKRVGRSYYTQARFDVVKVVKGYNGVAKRFCTNERLLYFASRFFSNVLEDLNFELCAVKPTAQANTSVSIPELPGWFSVLRCPMALSNNQPGQFRLLNDSWLVCDQSGCKYPICRGVPRINLDEAHKWNSVSLDNLSANAPPIHLIPVEDKPIDSIAAPERELPHVTSPGDLVAELLATYGKGRPLTRMLLAELGRHPKTAIVGPLTWLLVAEIAGMPFRLVSSCYRISKRIIRGGLKRVASAIGIRHLPSSNPPSCLPANGSEQNSSDNEIGKRAA